MIEMASEYKHLNKLGEYDYDYSNDVLFFKVKDREYSRSIELDDLVVDIDKENFVVGVQIFDASEFLRVSKENLRNVRRWKMQASVDQNTLEVRLMFQTIYRNKLIEPRPIIIQQLKEPLPDSKVVATIS